MILPFYKTHYIKVTENAILFKSKAAHELFQIHFCFLKCFIDSLSTLLIANENELKSNTEKKFRSKTDAYEITISSKLATFEDLIDKDILQFPYIVLPFFFEQIKKAILLAINPSKDQFNILTKIKSTQDLYKIVRENDLESFLQKHNCFNLMSFENFYFFFLHYDLLVIYIDF